jgi:membrane-associated protease RseP (regulator of RpoE activity)
MDGHGPERPADAPPWWPSLERARVERSARPPRRGRLGRLAWPISLLTLVASLFTSTTLGAGWYLSTRTDVTTDLVPLLGGETIRRVWLDPVLLRIGLSFSVPLLLILLCHELGHYLTCRRYGVPATPPFFLPGPVGLGTFGAFIRIKAPIRDKRVLLDVGAGGPIAGFAALLPFLFYGVAHSTPALVTRVPEGTSAVLLLIPGQSLGLRAVAALFHGPLPAGTVLDLHPFALAAWVGLLATALNLLPIGQLDGGHILYAAVGAWQRRLARPLWAVLMLAGFLWRGWWFWGALLLLMGLDHPRVANESLPLDPRRQGVALLCLVLLVLCFIPVPFEMASVAQ